MSDLAQFDLTGNERETARNNALIPELKAMVRIGGKRWHISLIDQRFLANISPARSLPFLTST